MDNLKNKRVLILGLGLLGGGVETTKWFYKKGARIIVTDLKSKKELKNSLEKLKNIKAKYILGKHRKEDIDKADIIAVNPAVSYKNELVQYAKKRGKEIVNDCYLFFKYAQGDIIAVTGTRGKTTTTIWIYEFLKNFFSKIILGGNQPNKSLLKIIKKTKKDTLSILEISSFQLEFYDKNLKAPKIAIITNIYNDHLNRYSGFQEYACTKAKIFQNQTANDYLILNFDNPWVNYFLKLKPQSQIYFVSLKSLPLPLKGAFIKNNNFILRDEKEIKILNIGKFLQLYGEHNLYNLFFSFLASYLYLKEKNKKVKNKEINILKSQIFKLQTPPLRQEPIYQSKRLTIINDSAGTSPEAVISALERFKKQNLILITGGTDKNLDFRELAKKIKKVIKPPNLILLNGTATQKLIKELEKIKFKDYQLFENLKDCLKEALKISEDYKNSLILFSPGSASFEKFKNEFDRGRKFNKLVKLNLRD